MKITELSLTEIVLTLASHGTPEEAKMAARALSLADDLAWLAHWVGNPNQPVPVFEECMPQLGEKPEENLSLYQKVWKKAKLALREEGHFPGLKYQLIYKDGTNQPALYLEELQSLVVHAEDPTQGYVLIWLDSHGVFQKTLTLRLHDLVKLPPSWYAPRRSVR